MRKYNLHSITLPFDWNITFEGIFNIINNNFIDYIPIDSIKNKYGVEFVHDIFPKDKDKYERRIIRLKNILETSTNEIFFMRKSHIHNHHLAYENIVDEIKDIQNLDILLKEKYPNLNYKIILFLICCNCYDKNQIYNVLSKNIIIFNLVTSNVDDIENLIEEKFKEIIL